MLSEFVDGKAIEVVRSGSFLLSGHYCGVLLSVSGLQHGDFLGGGLWRGRACVDLGKMEETRNIDCSRCMMTIDQC